MKTWAVIAIIILAAAVIGGIVYYVQKDKEPAGEQIIDNNNAIPGDRPNDYSTPAVPTPSPSPYPSPVQGEGKGSVTPPRTGKTLPVEDMSGVSVTFSGTVLAGSKAQVIDYNKPDFDKALAAKKLVVIYFYADWCPICRAEVPKMYEAFNELTSSDVVGFRVNYKDGFDDDHEKDLAREHGIGYQHTKVFVKNYERVLKSPESWDKERYLTEINNALK